MGWYGLDDPTGSGYEPVAGSCEQGNEPWGSIKFLSSYTTGGFSRRAQLHEVSFEVGETVIVPLFKSVARKRLVETIIDCVSDL
jgi:hypothetical protein